MDRNSTRLEHAEWRKRCPGIVTRTSQLRHVGADPCMALNISTATLNITLSGNWSQWRLTKSLKHWRFAPRNTGCKRAMLQRSWLTVADGRGVLEDQLRWHCRSPALIVSKILLKSEAQMSELNGKLSAAAWERYLFCQTNYRKQCLLLLHSIRICIDWSDLMEMRRENLSASLRLSYWDFSSSVSLNWV